MRLRSIASSVVLLTFLLAAPVIAQEHGQVGLSMGYPASVGVVWHVADRVAIRPEISLVQSSTDTTAITTVTFATSLGVQTQTTRAQFVTDSTTVGTGVSALFYVWKREALSAFVTPRYAYNRGTSTTTGGGIGTPTENTATNHFISGSFGAQYALGRRFSVFGEIGLGYTRSRVDNVPTDSLAIGASTGSETTSHGVSTRSAAGVVFYFNSSRPSS
jgi:hypothetical protein